jgi:hypothetical protein
VGLRGIAALSGPAADRMFGTDHPDTLAARYNVAHTLAEQGKTAEALTEFRQVLADRQRDRGTPYAVASDHEVPL